MNPILINMYILITFLLGVIVAQILKPVFLLITKREWDPKLIFASGGFPSSHTAGVIAMTLIVGLQDGFENPSFSICLAMSFIVAYDAANVRYYAGRNIEMTQQLIKDIQELTMTKLDDPVYMTKVKKVLGHKWVEVIGGVILGCVVAILYYNIIMK